MRIRREAAMRARHRSGRGSRVIIPFLAVATALLVLPFQPVAAAVPTAAASGPVSYTHLTLPTNREV